MKLYTHYIFTAGLLSLVFSLFHFDSYYSLVFSFLISFLANTVIDGLGHEKRAGIPVRTPLTHTVPRSVVWGFIASFPFVFFFFHEYNFVSYLPALVISGLIVGPSHMFLDVFTERGIYVKKNGKWKRFALAHLKYNDPFANGLAILLGAGFFYLSYHLFLWFS